MNTEQENMFVIKSVLALNIGKSSGPDGFP